MGVGWFDPCLLFNKPQLAFVLSLFSVSHFSESKGRANRSQEHYLDLHFLCLPCLLCLKSSTKVRTVLLDWTPAWRGAAQPSHACCAIPSVGWDSIALGEESRTLPSLTLLLALLWPELHVNLGEAHCWDMDTHSTPFPGPAVLHFSGKLTTVPDMWRK